MSRRHFLEGSAVGLAGLSAPRALAQIPGLPDVGRKFGVDGRVMPFAGNTIVCHLPQQGEHSESFDALLNIYRAMPAEDWMRKVTATPPSSYHMTIFGGANDKARQYPLWPAGAPLDLPMKLCDQILGERLQRFRLGENGPPYKMHVNLAEPSVKEMPLTIRLLPFDPQTEQRLRRLRDALSVVTGIRADDHDRYEFHITLGYQFAPLTEPERSAFRLALARWKAMLAMQAPVITLGDPEYCTLDDMFAFKRQFYLS
ncbi:MAG: hypothetical protein B7Y43_03950 [Sphingomonas sp. 28-62-20]|uniref:DUF1868 domain-containing protein n=1 Tax=Sphingomonas sp. 28-62-20 TaxID=1970433 RepID=UPI000BCE6E43|nr:MAG: hypothetical protein B7Y43_03950 [Sphingomonas sp. 28-62-20]